MIHKRKYRYGVLDDWFSSPEFETMDKEYQTSDPATNEVAKKTGNFWTFTDKLLGTADRAGSIVNKIKSGTPYGTTTSNGMDVTIGRQESERPIGILGLPSPWGGVLIVGFVGLVGFAIYKGNKK